MIPTFILYIIIVLLSLPYLGLFGVYLYYKKKKKSMAIPTDGEASNNNFLEYFNHINHGKEENYCSQES